MRPATHAERALTVPGDQQRAEDKSVWFRISFALEKYKVLVYAVVAGLIALGFDFKTPAQASLELRAQIAELRVQVASLQADNLRQTASVSKLLRLYCLDSRIPARDKDLVELDCTPGAKQP